jgi:hypothetical protein
MDRIKTSSATENNLFTEGNPAQGVPATEVSAKWLNDVQEEIANVIEAEGIVLDETKQDQLKTAIQSMIAAIPAPEAKDLIARDGIILNAFRIAEYTALATGSLVEGYEWLLRAASEMNLTNAFYDTSGSLITNVTPTSYDNPMGMGDRTGQIGVTMSFTSNGGEPGSYLINGTTGSGITVKSVTPVVGQTITFDFGAPQYISEARGYWMATDGTWKWQYSDDNSVWSDVPGSTFLKGGDTPTQDIPLAPVGAHRYWRMIGVEGYTTNNWWQEMEFKILAAADRQKMNMAATAAASITASAQPDDATLYFIHQAVDVVTMGTDCKVSMTRDGGTTWAEGTIEMVADYDGSYQFYKANADLTSQPAGTSMNFKIETFNLKEQRVHTIAEQWG